MEKVIAAYFRLNKLPSNDVLQKREQWRAEGGERGDGAGHSS